jgi:hypothetical protein
MEIDVKNIHILTLEVEQGMGAGQYAFLT